MPKRWSNQAKECRTEKCTEAPEGQFFIGGCRTAPCTKAPVSSVRVCRRVSMWCVCVQWKSYWVQVRDKRFFRCRVNGSFVLLKTNAMYLAATTAGGQLLSLQWGYQERVSVHFLFKRQPWPKIPPGVCCTQRQLFKGSLSRSTGATRILL